MARYGYGYVPEKGFIAFGRELSEGTWKDVSLKKFDPSHERWSGHALLEAPKPVVWKLRCSTVIEFLREAVGGGTTEALEALDETWDRLQRKLYHSIGQAAEDDATAHRQAAGRLRGSLLLGNGTGQTILGYDEEVDFGWQQVELSTKGAAADDVKLLGLGGLIGEIGKATEALAKGLGRGPGQKRTAARSVRIRNALTACAAAFNGVHDDIAWMVDHSEAGPAHDQLRAMLAPFEGLLDRYPPVAKEVGAVAAPAGPVAVVGNG